jgi:hypothetical protein
MGAASSVGTCPRALIILLRHTGRLLIEYYILISLRTAGGNTKKGGTYGSARS